MGMDDLHRRFNERLREASMKAAFDPKRPPTPAKFVSMVVSAQVTWDQAVEVAAASDLHWNELRNSMRSLGTERKIRDLAHGGGDELSRLIGVLAGLGGLSEFDHHEQEVLHSLKRAETAAALIARVTEKRSDGDHDIAQEAFTAFKDEIGMPALVDRVEAWHKERHQRPGGEGGPSHHASPEKCARCPAKPICPHAK